MDRRLALHDILTKLLGSNNVYFQPPTNIKMKHPCIVYERSNINTIYSNNFPYKHMTGYLATIIDPNPDSKIPEKVRQLPLSSFDRHYTADNLNHDVYNIFY